jgi:hypothetical protein
MKNCRGVHGCIDPRFLDLGTSWMWVFTLGPCRLTPEKEPPTMFEWETGRASESMKNITFLTLTGMEHQSLGRLARWRSQCRLHSKDTTILLKESRKKLGEPQNGGQGHVRDLWNSGQDRYCFTHMLGDVIAKDGTALRFWNQVSSVQGAVLSVVTLRDTTCYTEKAWNIENVILNRQPG